MAAQPVVLVVDDDPQVRKLVSSVASAEGYSVLEASTQQEAIDRATTYGPGIRLLLADVNIPGGNGRDLARKIGMLDPDVRVVYMSGRTADELLGLGVVPGGTDFLEKPFALDTLRAVLR
jgi:two-component system, cell cycle sensor histidine kinase and response regulator CckA